MKAKPLPIPILSVTRKERFDVHSLRGVWMPLKEYVPKRGRFIIEAIKGVSACKGKDILMAEDVRRCLSGKILLGPSVMKALLNQHVEVSTGEDGEESVLEKIYQENSAIKLCFPGCDLTDKEGNIFWIYLFRVGFNRWTQNVRWHNMGFDRTFTFVTYSVKE